MEVAWQEQNTQILREIAALRGDEFNNTSMSVHSNQRKLLWDYFPPIYPCPLVWQVGRLPDIGDGGRVISPPHLFQSSICPLVWNAHKLLMGPCPHLCPLCSPDGGDFSIFSFFSPGVRRLARQTILLGNSSLTFMHLASAHPRFSALSQTEKICLGLKLVSDCCGGSADHLFPQLKIQLKAIRISVHIN